MIRVLQRAWRYQNRWQIRRGVNLTCTACLLLAFSLATMLAMAQKVKGSQAETRVQYQLELYGAVLAGPSKVAKLLILDLERAGSNWGPVYGVARDYNQAFHKGAVLDSETKGESRRIKVGIFFHDDMWVKGGWGLYEIEFREDGDTVKGNFTGMFNGEAVSGAVSGKVYSSRPDPSYIPPLPGEHPRLLFRKNELGTLREKLKTSFGQAAQQRLAASGTPAALGLLYQLTGDRSWLEKGLSAAWPYVQKVKVGSDPFVPLRPLWSQLEQTALFYDLCREALPEDFIKAYLAWVANNVYAVFYAPETLGRTNWVVVSNHVANVYSGMLLTALAVFDEPGTLTMQDLVEPFWGEHIPPLEGEIARAAGIIEERLVPGKSPSTWLHTPLLPHAIAFDSREVFWGLERWSPLANRPVRLWRFEVEFGKGKIPSHREQGGFALAEILKAGADARLEQPVTFAAYTVVKVEQPGWYVVRNPSTRANTVQLAINGRCVMDGQVVQLDAGQYALTLLAQCRMRWQALAPHLALADEQAIALWRERVESLKKEYAIRKAYYQALIQWSGKADPVFQELFRLSRFVGRLHCEHAVGRGGFQAEVGHYSIDAMSGFAKAWPVFRRVMGYDLSDGEEYPSVIPRKLIGGPQDINGTTELPAGFFASLFPSLREEWKPEILEAWHQKAGVTGSDTVYKVLDHEPVFAFINYPLGMKPVPLGTRLPLVWEAPGMGYYALRSGWTADAFIAQVFAKSRHISGWNGANAGTYRLFGMGVEWVCGPTDRVRRRVEENVVILPELELQDNACGQVTYFRSDGRTMVVSMRLDDVYEYEGRFEYGRYGRVRYLLPDGPPEPSGIRAWRSIAFDFSGKAGVPCLFAVVDRIEGAEGKKRVWLYQYAPRKSRTKSVSITPTQGGFVEQVEGTAAKLYGTFIHPKTVSVRIEPFSYSYVKTWGQQRGQKITVEINALTAESSDHFFFVGMVTDQEPPVLSLKGNGLNTVVKIKDRVIRFDGENLHLE